MTNKNLKRKFLIFNENFAFCFLFFEFIKICLVFSILLSFPKLVYSSEPNNKFGIHLAQPHEEDLNKAAQLVNTGGGDWGYVTLVMQENDRHQQKWQGIFDYLRQKHLIPIIRLATQPVGSSWRRPSKAEAAEWANFLDSLNWVVKKRYIVLFNEPNYANEWGGEANPQDYAEVAFAFAKALKDKNPDFFVMLAGFDASAPHQPPKFWDEELFIKSILNFKFEILDYLDGWASHSYPNPAFSGSPLDWGRGTVRTYQWELELLKNLGVNKNLPVFITETGWKHRISNVKTQMANLNEEIIANYFKIAFEQVWLPDERVRAVTPFILNYQSEPFLGFSWRKYQSDEFYRQYYLVQSLAKPKGEPERVEKGEISFDLPKELVEQSTYQLSVQLKNLGQAIWEKNEGYSLSITGLGEDNKPFDYFFSDFSEIKPLTETSVALHLKTNPLSFCQSSSCPQSFQDGQVRLILRKGDKKILESQPWRFKIIPLPSLKFKVNLFPKLIENSDDFEIQIFDEKENLVFKKSQLTVTSGRSSLEEIHNIIPGKKYRLVILKPQYLPRQNFIIFKKGENIVRFPPLLPFDFNNDGQFSLVDLLTLAKNPQFLHLFLP